MVFKGNTPFYISKRLNDFAKIYMIKTNFRYGWAI